MSALDFIWWGVGGIVFAGIIRQRRHMARAFNAVQAEATLRVIELVPENSFCNELRDAVVTVVQESEKLPDSLEGCIGRFNGASRLQQLNTVALALARLGHRPILTHLRSPWGWWRVRRPLSARVSPFLLDQVVRRARDEQGLEIEISEAPLLIEGAYLFDRRDNSPRRAPSLAQIEEIIGSADFQRCSLAVRLDVLLQRERTKAAATEAGCTRPALDPPRDIVELLVELRPPGSSKHPPDPAWDSSPEFQVLHLAGQMAALCRNGADEAAALEVLGFLEHRSNPTSHGRLSLENVGCELFGAAAPLEHVRYIVRFARQLHGLRELPL